MSTNIHYFQRYSQRENVATNNTLLLFSRLYYDSIHKFNDFLSNLMESEDISVGLRFSQQDKNGSSVPDGSFGQPSFKVVIETKLHNKFDESQLINHLKAFSNEEKKILIGLSPAYMSKKSKEKITEIAKKENVKFINVTFEKIVKAFREALVDYDFELHAIIEDFEKYCYQEGLIKEDQFLMRILPCGPSFDINKKHKLYFAPADRGYTEHGYLGIYANKSVRGIGKIKNIIDADIKDGNIDIKKSKKNTTEEEAERIIDAIKETKETLGWNIESGHKFFIMEEFYDTDFKKESKGGIMGARFFNLKDIIGEEKNISAEELAKRLRENNWE
ncbi:hypothetical protein [uncultured Ilyobacter sp.]|uniref:hypothetical protein n=1 Tax=uncultured Ilyobacter sp. TaxID=544433 RepID=UPI0029C6B5DE|nr:hypothetical protein [uncultured Ilyobacter sp.]